jgi:hypothetical protein
MYYFRQKGMYCSSILDTQDLKKADNYVRREVLYNNAIQCDTFMKLFRLIMLCFYET